MKSVIFIQLINRENLLLAEVVGFKRNNIIFMPYTEVSEIGPGCLVESTGKPLTIKVGRGFIRTCY